MREYNLRHNKTDTDRARKYTLWDADKTTACECDEGWMGYDCSQRQCVFGDDPLSYGVRLSVWGCVPICVLLAQTMVLTCVGGMYTILQTREIQTVRTTADHRDETQQFIITTSAGTDTDEIQIWGFSDGNTGPIPLTGFYTLTFTTTIGTCTVCATFASETTSTLSVDASAATVEAALEALSNIDDVTVERNANGGSEGYTYTVTFVGNDVGGNVPLLSMSRTVYGDSASTTVPYTNTAGVSPTGSFTISLDGSSSNPSVSNTTSSAVDLDASLVHLPCACVLTWGCLRWHRRECRTRRRR